jgi:hypothetical protein
VLADLLLLPCFKYGGGGSHGWGACIEKSKGLGVAHNLLLMRIVMWLGVDGIGAQRHSDDYDYDYDY